MMITPLYVADQDTPTFISLSETLRDVEVRRRLFWCFSSALVVLLTSRNLHLGIATASTARNP